MVWSSFLALSDYLNLFCLETPTFMNAIVTWCVSYLQCNTIFAVRIEMGATTSLVQSLVQIKLQGHTFKRRRVPLSYKVSVIALLILTICIVSLLIARC